MSFYTYFCSNLLFPLQDRLKRHNSLTVRRQLEKSQWWAREKIIAAQNERLHVFIQAIGKNVPYYRSLFLRLGISSSEIRDSSSLTGLPFLTKSIIKQNTDELKADGHGRLKKFNTGGSSGEPLIFYLGKNRISHDVGAKWRATRWWGVDIGDKELVVWGSPIELGAQDRLRRLRDALMRSYLIPAFEMSEGKLDSFIETIQKLRPRMLFGYPSALSLIARHAAAGGRSMSDLGIKVAFVTSERLYDDQRKLISSVFGCPVANGYGSRDAGFIAHECPSGGMHIMSEEIIVEIVDEQGHIVADDQPGEIVITHLGTEDFPFVRYKTGDIAIMDKSNCKCGRGLPMLREIQGRSTDFIISEDGAKMHGLSLIYIIRDLPGVREFKIIQYTRMSTTVLIVADPCFDSECIDFIVAGFRVRLGMAVEVRVELVQSIEAEKSGKFRYVVSHAV